MSHEILQQGVRLIGAYLVVGTLTLVTFGDPIWRALVHAKSRAAVLPKVRYAKVLASSRPPAERIFRIPSIFSIQKHVTSRDHASSVKGCSTSIQRIFGKSSSDLNLEGISTTVDSRRHGQSSDGPGVGPEHGVRSIVCSSTPRVQLQTAIS